jgi:hypothetical protein
MLSTGRAADSTDYMVSRLAMWSQSTCGVARGYAHCEPTPVPESADGLRGDREAQGTPRALLGVRARACSAWAMGGGRLWALTGAQSGIGAALATSLEAVRP